MEDYLEVCEAAARAGGKELVRGIGRAAVREKGRFDLVTEADLAAQEAVHAVVRSEFPDHGLVGEETHSGFDSTAEYCWVVDPLDGTTNFVHQLPHFCVSVALVHRGRPLVAVVLDPMHDECFSAQRGRGARLNGNPIRVSSVTQLTDALVAASFAAHVEADSPEIAQFISALLECQAVRRTGSAALNLCYVAAGRFDVFWALSTKAWDVAAGVLIVEEAGGIVTHHGGEPLDLLAPHPLACATLLLHESFKNLLRSATESR